MLFKSNSPQVTRTLLSTIAEFNSPVDSIVSIIPLISNSFSLFSRFFGIVPMAPNAIEINAMFIFQNFSSSLTGSMYLASFSPSFSFIHLSAGTAKTTG